MTPGMTHGVIHGASPKLNPWEAPGKSPVFPAHPAKESLKASAVTVLQL